MIAGEVICLDRGFPLVKTKTGKEYRCEHATTLIKESDQRAAIGDKVQISLPKGHDKAVIVHIEPRKRVLVRKDPTEQVLPQVLAANFDTVIIAQPVLSINLRRMERELVLAHETGAKVLVVLTKADLIENKAESDQCIAEVAALVGADPLFIISSEDSASIEQVKAYILPEQTAVLIGQSGVGKSTLINLLVGEKVQETAAVRSGDGKGRHTTVNRSIIDIPGAGRIIDMPGVRGLGLWDAQAGIEATFPDIEAYAKACKFRDCKHGDEPRCAVRAAVETGELSSTRVDSYRLLKQELDDLQEQKEEAQRIKGKGKSARRSKSRK